MSVNNCTVLVIQASYGCAQRAGTRDWWADSKEGRDDQKMLTFALSKEKYQDMWNSTGQTNGPKLIVNRE